MSALTFAPEGHGLMRCSEDRKQEDRKTKQQPVGMYSVILLRRDTHDLTKENTKTGMEYEKHVTVTSSHQNTQKLTEVCIFIPLPNCNLPQKLFPCQTWSRRAKYENQMCSLNYRISDKPFFFFFFPFRQYSTHGRVDLTTCHS